MKEEKSHDTLVVNTRGNLRSREKERRRKPEEIRGRKREKKTNPNQQWHPLNLDNVQIIKIGRRTSPSSPIQSRSPMQSTFILKVTYATNSNL